MARMAASGKSGIYDLQHTEMYRFSVPLAGSALQSRLQIIIKGKTMVSAALTQRNEATIIFIPFPLTQDND